VEYRRFHMPYLWLATFAKYFIDYLMCHSRVELADFRSDFFQWLEYQ